MLYEQAFEIWKSNKNYPTRKKYTSKEIDLDGDGAKEFVIDDSRGNKIAVNGYYLGPSNYPERYAYQETVDRDQITHKPIMNFDSWRDSVLGTRKERFNKDSLCLNYPENFSSSVLYSASIVTGSYIGTEMLCFGCIISLS